MNFHLKSYLLSYLAFIALVLKSYCDASSPPIVTGIHHVKVPVSNINVSLAWYTRVMGAKHLTNLDHINAQGQRYAVELMLPSFGRTAMELRLNSDQAKSQEMFDPITWGVESLDQIKQWEEWLVMNNVATSPVFTGVTGWLLVFQVSCCLFPKIAQFRRVGHRS
jgi:hypothetical protein